MRIKNFLLLLFICNALSAYSQRPVIGSLAPAADAVGSQVIISGSNFSRVADNNNEGEDKKVFEGKQAASV